MIGARPLGFDEIKAISQAFQGAYRLRDKALFILGLSTGLRISELLSLTIKDVWDSNNQCIKSSIHIARKNTKGKTGARTIPLTNSARQALEEYLSDVGINRPEAYLFESQRKGKPIDRIRAYQILEAAYQSLGLNGKLGCHAMRKTFAHRIYEYLNYDLVKTQRALGHKNINSTVSYLGFNADQDVNAAILAIEV